MNWRMPRFVGAPERVVSRPNAHVGYAAAFSLRRIADGGVVFVQATAQTVAELGMIDAVRAPRQQ